jgi:hypothetical protein
MLLKIDFWKIRAVNRRDSPTMTFLTFAFLLYGIWVSVRPTRQNEKLEEGQGPDSIELFAWR